MLTGVPCVDHGKVLFKNPAGSWAWRGRRFHRMRRRRISFAVEVLPKWRAGIEAVDMPHRPGTIIGSASIPGMRWGK